MNDARHFMSETSLQNGRVPLAGGYPNNDQSHQSSLDLPSLKPAAEAAGGCCSFAAS
jgi:hypothetical protein